MRQLIDGQLICYFIYFIGSIIIGFCTGILFLSNCKSIHLPRISCFLAGFSLTPYIISAYMLFMSFIPYTLPRLFYIIPLYILAIFLIIRNRNAWIPIIYEWFSSRDIFSYFEKRFYALWFVCLYFTYLYPCLPVNILHEVYGSSIVEPLLKALFLLIPLIFLSFLFRVTKRKSSLSVNVPSRTYILFFRISKECDTEQLYSLKKEIRLTSSAHKALFGAFYLLLLFIMIFYCKTVQQLYGFFYNSTALSKILRYLGFGIASGTLALLLIIPVYIGAKQYKKGDVSSFAYVCRFFFSIMASLAITVLLRQVIIASYCPVTGADASQYLSAALRYVQTLRFSSITLFEGTPDGSLIPLMHHPAWITYLGNALLHTPTAQVGMTFDFPARLAFQMTYLYLFSAIAACSTAFVRQKKGTTLLAVAMPLCYVWLHYIYTSSSKDAFRLVPIILLPAILFGAEQALCENQKAFKPLLTSFLLGYFVMAGHPINALTAVSIVAAFSIYLLLQKRLLCVKTFLLYFSTAVGALAGSFQMLLAFFRTGSLMGKSYDAATLLTGTSYLDNFLNYNQGRLKNTTTYLERLILILTRDNGVLSIPAILSAIAVVLAGLYLYLKRKQVVSSFWYLALIILCNSILLTDIVQWSGISLTQWSVMNLRYTFQLYIFWGIFLTAGIDTFINYLQPFGTRYKLLFFTILCIYTTFPLSTVSFDMPQYTALERYYSSNSLIDEYIQGLTAISDFSGERILIDNYYANYYLNNSALTFLSDRASPIRHAQTPEDLDHAMQEENIRIIMLTSSLRDVYWEDTVLEQYIHDNEYVIPLDEEGDILLYQRVN